MENPWDGYLKGELYLPTWIRDWHDQKLFFKIMAYKFKQLDSYGNWTQKMKEMAWVDIHCIAIEILLYFAKHGWELRRSNNGMTPRSFKDDMTTTQAENPAHFWGAIPDFDMPDIVHYDLHEFDAALSRLEGWECEDYDDPSIKETMNPETLKKASDWLYDLAGMYLAKYHEPMPVPIPLPESSNAIDLEWQRKNDVCFLAAVTLEDDCDYYGKDDRTGDDLHGLFPATREKNEEIIAFLHRMNERNEKTDQENTKPWIGDKMLAIMTRAGAKQFTTDSWGIGNVFHDIKEKFPGEFDDVRFTSDDGNYYSEEIESVLQSLSMTSVISTMGPDYRYYYVPRNTMERVENEVIPSLPRSFLDALPEMAKMFSRISRQC